MIPYFTALSVVSRPAFGPQSPLLLPQGASSQNHAGLATLERTVNGDNGMALHEVMRNVPFTGLLGCLWAVLKKTVMHTLSRTLFS